MLPKIVIPAGIDGLGTYLDLVLSKQKEIPWSDEPQETLCHIDLVQLIPVNDIAIGGP